MMEPGGVVIAAIAVLGHLLLLADTLRVLRRRQMARRRRERAVWERLARLV